MQKNGLSWSDYEGLNQIKREQLSPRRPVNKRAHAVHLDTASFTETGGVSALAGTGHKEDVGYSTLGARLATYYLLQNGMALIPRASVAWQHAFGDVTPTAALSFQSIGSGFNTLGVPIARDAALVEAGGDLQLTAQAKVGVSYAGQLANSAHDHSVKGNFTWRF